MITEDNEVVDMIMMFDSDGMETEDEAEAVSCVGELACGRWLSCDLTAFVSTEVH